MSANVQLVTLFVVLVLAAAAIRVAVGPMVIPADGASLYAQNKFGPAPDLRADTVEFAVSDAR